MHADPTAIPWLRAEPGAAAARLLGGEVHVWWLDLASPRWPLAELSGWLGANEAAQAARFHFDVHRLRYIAAHGQMRALLAAYLGSAPQELRFEREERGKPRLAHTGAHELLSFNLSHSEDQGLLAISRGTTLGVDIEVQRPLSDLDALARSHFAAQELQTLHRLPPARHHDAFFAAWTRKEAYVKALGAGLSVPLDGFEVTVHPDEPAALRSIGGSETAAREWTLWAARPRADTWAAVAVQATAATVRTFSLRHPQLP